MLVNPVIKIKQELSWFEFSNTTNPTSIDWIISADLSADLALSIPYTNIAFSYVEASNSSLMILVYGVR